jgi:CMP-N-acetylneuraminic acid synthetase
MSVPRVIAIIPARGGSKSVPRKNIKLLAGKPLIAHMLDAALGSKLVTTVAMSSEDKEIQDVVQKWGKDRVEIIKRPAELAQDDTPSLPVIEHAVKLMEEKHGRYDYVVMLQLTTPFIRSEDIDESLKILIDTGADSVLSVCKANSYHPVKMKKIREDGRLVQYIDGLQETQFTRQKLDPVYRRNGGVYAHKRDVVMEKKKLYGGDDVDTRPYIMSDERSIDINSIADFLAADAIHTYLTEGGEERFGKK